MKKIQTAKMVCRMFIIFLISGAILSFSFQLIMIWHFGKETNRTDEISPQYDGPIVYAVLLDTDSSMQLNFPGIGDGLKDRMKLYACLLGPDDTLAIFPQNFPAGDYIVFQGSEDLEECVSKIEQIECFTKENEKSVETWVSEVTEFLSHCTEKTHLEIISDKSMDEFQKAGISSQVADEIIAVVSANHIVFDYAGYGLSSWEMKESGKNFATVYTFNRHYYAKETVDGVFDVDITFPNLTKQFILVLSGENMHMTGIHLSENSFDSVGFTLSNGDRVFYIEVATEIDYCSLLGSGKGSVSVVYTYPVNVDIVNDRSQQATIADKSEGAYLFYDSALAGLVMALITIIIYTILVYAEKRKRKQILMNKQVFISYRRSGAAALAHAIVERLASQGFCTFMDVENLRNGEFDVQLLDEIENSACVVLVLPADGLQRCLYDPGDWVRKEVEHAIEYKVPLIPVLMNGFHFPASLPGKLKKLPEYNAIWFDEQKNYEGSMIHVLEFVKQIYQQAYFPLDGDITDRKKLLLSQWLFSTFFEEDHTEDQNDG